jgi:AraC-like DNA-binding protein
VKVIPFTVPVPSNSSIHAQHDVLPFFYEHLHRHREAQLTWIVKGSGTLLAGQGVFPFSAGQVYFIGAGLPHVFRSAASATPTHYDAEAWTLFFDPLGPLAAVLQLPELQPVQRWLQHYSHGCRVAAADEAEAARLLQLTACQQQQGRLVCFLQLLQHLAGSRQHQPLTSWQRTLPEAEGQRLSSILQYSHQHLHRSIGLPEVAALGHMSVPAFCRYFKKHTGKTYIRFLNELRIQTACRQLQHEPEAGIAAAAYTSGFQHVASFNRVFRQQMGQTPGEYMRQWTAVQAKN